jgi:hypothetical protein
MSTPNPLLVAGTPALIAVLQAIKQFNANIGADPAKWVITVPGALTILLGTVELQLPALATAEAGAALTDVNARIDSWITKLQAAAK